MDHESRSNPSQAVHFIPPCATTAAARVSAQPVTPVTLVTVVTPLLALQSDVEVEPMAAMAGFETRPLALVRQVFGIPLADRRPGDSADPTTAESGRGSGESPTQDAGDFGDNGRSSKNRIRRLRDGE